MQSELESRPHVLIVEDDPEVAELMSRILVQDGFSVDLADSVEAAHLSLSKRRPVLSLVDLGLPDGSGLTLISQTLSRQGCAIIVVTGRNDETDQVLGLEMGADDFISKPFRPRVLLARVHAVLRRQATAEPPQGVLSFCGFRLLPGTRQLMAAGGAEVDLTTAEFDMLAVLVRLSGETLSRDRLAGELRGGNWHGNQRLVDGLVSRLRRKFAEYGASDQLIRTVHGRGYIFVGEVRSESAQAPAMPELAHRD